MAKGNKTGGRKAGTPNRMTSAVKEALQTVYDDLQAKSGGGHKHFSEWAEGNPTEFYKLYAKLLPQEVKAEVGDQNGEPLIFRSCALPRWKSRKASEHESAD